MTLNDYQEQAMTTCMETSNNVSYMLLGLQEEAGELAGKFSKAIRKGWITIKKNDIDVNIDCTAEDFMELKYGILKEAGDVLWMLAGFCYTMGVELEDVARMNLDKLAARKKNHTIDGEGDNR